MKPTQRLKVTKRTNKLINLNFTAVPVQNNQNLLPSLSTLYENKSHVLKPACQQNTQTSSNQVHRAKIVKELHKHASTHLYHTHMCS